MDDELNISTEETEYTKVGEIPDIGIENFQRIELVPRKEVKKFRGHRFDLGTTKVGLVHDGLAVSGPTSSFYLDKSDNGVYLSSGVYINAQQLIDATLKYVEKQGELDIIVGSKSTGRRLNYDALVQIVLEAGKSGKFVVDVVPTQEPVKKDPSIVAVGSSIGKQRAPEIEVGQRLDYDMLCLQNGEYISVEEFQKALSEYVLMTSKGRFEKPADAGKNPEGPEDVPEKPKPEKPEPISPQPNEPEPQKPEPDPISKDDEPDHKPDPEPEKEPASRTGKTSDDAKKWVAGSLAFIPLIVPVFDETQIQGPSTTETTVYVQQWENETVKLSEEEALKRTLDGLDLGEEIPVEDGMKYYESSDYNLGGKSGFGTIGVTSGREAGNYEVSGVSIIEKNVGILDSTLESGVNVGEFYSQVLEKTGKTQEEVDVIIHFGADDKVSGWVSAEALLESEINENTIQQYMVPGSKYTVTTEVEENGVITFNNGTEDVQVKIVDEDGNRLAEGVDVVGSDGETYQLLDIEDSIVEGETITEWQLSVPATIAASAMASAVATAIYHSVKKGKEEKDGFVLPEGTNDELSEKMDAFHKAKGEYDSSSLFHSMSQNPVISNQNISGPTTEISNDAELSASESLGGVKK